MSTGVTERPALEPGRRRIRAGTLSSSGWVAVVCLAILLVVNLPLFVCMPLDSDVTFYDVCAQNLLRGGVEYRDALEHGLPGMTWIHAWIRPLVGWRSEPMRLIDAGVVGLALTLLVMWLGYAGRGSGVRAWGAALFAGFYFSTSEWSHCQRDVWILLPAMLGLTLRDGQIGRFLRGRGQLAPLAVYAFIEGVCWAAAVWLKPFVLIPCLCAWGVGAASLLRARAPKRWMALAVDAAGMLAGGLVIGGAGIAYLRTSGAWPYFLDVMRNWNPEYYKFGREQGWTLERIHDLGRGLFPWVLVHLVAVPIAVALLMRAFRAPEAAGRVRLRQALLASAYLGWLFQAVALQNLLEYIHVAPIFLALAVILSAATPVRLRYVRCLLLRRRRPTRWTVRRDRLAWTCLVAGFLALALLYHPMFQLRRLSCWPACLNVKRGSTPEIKDDLSLVDHVDWHDLHEVAKFINIHGRIDGWITCYSNGTQALYIETQIRPSTRFVFLDTFLACFVNHHDEIMKEVMNSKQHYVVTDLRTLGINRVRGEVARSLQSLDPILPDEVRGQFPWSEPVAFRVGLYTVHEVGKPKPGPEKVPPWDS